MAKTITLTNINILEWTVDIVEQNIRVLYQVEDDTNTVWETSRAVFWVTMPEVVNDPPENWYQIPEQYISLMQGLTQDAATAIANKILA